MNTLKFQNSLFKILIELLIFDKKTRTKVKSKWTKLKLQKYVDLSIQNLNSHDNKINKDSKIIWQYWHQGFDKAPLLIQKCINSTKKFNSDYDIKVLNFNTIEDWVEIPSRYYDLLKKGKIPVAIFSDILRLNLLKTYGGIWADSTIFFTGKINDDILKSDFFIVSKDIKKDASKNCVSCYLIKSTSNNIWLNLIKDAIDFYWAENDYLINYFMFEHLLTMLIYSSSNLIENWEKIPKYYGDDMGILQKKLYEKFEEDEFNKIKKISNIHKLSYKILKDEKIKGLYYNKLMELM